VFNELKILNVDLLEKYKSSINTNINDSFKNILDEPKEKFEFNFYLASAATYSSNIEGNSVDFDSYIKYKENNFNLKKKEVVEIDNLIKAYEFAQQNELILKNLLLAHKIYGKGFIPSNYLGKSRKSMVGVRGGGELVYLAIEAENIKSELEKLFSDIDYLLRNNLTIEEVFYFASMIHLVFVYIHPFIDGNGRGTRLLEKWFLAKKLGIKAWNIQTEKNYYKNRNDYYKNIQLGGNYYVINYKASLPFLLMLPNSLIC
jgi:Fic family protein